MDKCRICFKTENILYCIRDIEKSRRISFREMITSFAIVRNIAAEEYNKICTTCKVKTAEAYDFKMLIERSDMILQDLNPLKLFKFCNINEIKSKLNYKKKEDKPSLPVGLMSEIEEGKTCTLYNNTIITKSNIRNQKENKEIAVFNFLQSIKMKNEDCTSDNNINYYSANSDDDELIAWKPMKNKYKKKRKPTEVMKDGVVCNVRIKPVYLKDVQVLYYDHQNKKDKKELYRMKYAQNRRKDICCYCGKLTRSLNKHQLIHTGERRYNCDVCPKTYLTESQLKNHKKKHLNIRSYKCDICVATFLRATDLRCHKKMHSNARSFFCNICNKGFKRKCTLTTHLRRHNSENRNIKCDQCNMTFYSNIALRHHIRVHTGERPYKCEICSQPYSYKRDFNRHCFKKHGVFLKRRSVNVMNEEVLMRERALINELLLRKQGVVKNDQIPDLFEGPQSALAFEQVMQELENRPINESF